jgi:hypothetical protein
VALRILLAKNRFRVRGFLITTGVAAVCQLLARPIPASESHSARSRRECRRQPARRCCAAGRRHRADQD